MIQSYTNLSSTIFVVDLHLFKLHVYVVVTICVSLRFMAVADSLHECYVGHCLLSVSIITYNARMATAQLGSLERTK
jgi:hypothetical protein